MRKLTVLVATGMATVLLAGRAADVKGGKGMSASVKREGKQLILRGFPKDTDYHVRGFAELLALKDCLAYLGVRTDWTDLLGYSGDAFGCDGMTGLTHLRSTDVLSAASEAYGFDGRWGIDNGRTRDPDPVLSQVKEVLGKGRPIIACGARLSPWDKGTYCAEWTVILGVNTEDRRLLLSHGLEDLCWGSAAYRWCGRVPWVTGDFVQRDKKGLPRYWQGSNGFYLIGRAKTVPPATRVRAALRQAINIHRKEEVELHFQGAVRQPAGRGFVQSWPQRFRFWASRITDPSRDFKHKGFEGGHAVEDCYFALVAHAMRRSHAARFLRRHADVLPPAARKHLAEAAVAYEKSSALSEGLFRRIAAADGVEKRGWHARLRHGPDWLDDGLGEPKKAQLKFLKPPIGRTEKELASAKCIRARIEEQLPRPDVLKEAMRTTERILVLEDQAIAEIEKALAAADTDEKEGGQAASRHPGALAANARRR